MRQLIILFLYCCVGSGFGELLSCPGGRIEYRKTGKFCCYDKETTTCYKIIKSLMGDEEDRALKPCPSTHPLPLLNQCCNTTGDCIPNPGAPKDELGDELGDELADENDIGDEERRPPPPCTRPYPFLVGGRCCHRIQRPHRCIRRCPPRHPYRVGLHCCTKPTRPNHCILLDEDDDLGDEIGQDEIDLADEDEDPGHDPGHDDEDRQSPSRCVRPYPFLVQGRCCNRIALPNVCIARCPRSYPFRIDSRCCTARRPPRRCIWRDED